MERIINVYVRTKTFKEMTVNPYGVMEEIEVKRNFYSSTVKNKDTNEDMNVNVVFTKECKKTPPIEHSVISFTTENCSYVAREREYFNKRTKRIEKFVERNLYIKDFEIISKIEKKVTTDEDLPF